MSVDKTVKQNDGHLDGLDLHRDVGKVNHSYTRFIKAMRYILPLIALGLLAIVATWSDMDNQIVAVPKEELIPLTETIIGQTELTNPRFESVDEFNQPILVVANQALQSQSNPDLVNLINPVADFKTESGNAMHVEANAGTLEQKEEKLFLQNNVIINHDEGYVLEAEELRVNMKTKQAFSDKDVRITSEKGVITAEGLDGNMETGILIFKGPAKLTLKDAPPI
jgi:lipopolysaccharide export system protein LptC